VQSSSVTTGLAILLTQQGLMHQTAAIDSAINYPLWSWCMTRRCMVYIMTIVTAIAPTTT
jgi:hypothetical protein